MMFGWVIIHLTFDRWNFNFSLQVLHLSLKVAQLVELQGKSDEAKTNYIWTITKLEEKLKREQQDDDLHELWGLANNS